MTNTKQSFSESRTPNRWIVALAGAWLQLFLGTVYAWSYFQNPISEAYGWTNTEVAGAFSLAICFLGLAAAWGGTKLPRYGPRRLAAIGGVLFGAGYLVAAAALRWRSLPLLYLGYGVVGGAGLGLGYVTPVATVAKWFPDKKGLATGLVIMGFGFGALLMSKLVAPALCQWSGNDLAVVFTCLGRRFYSGGPCWERCFYVIRRPAGSPPRCRNPFPRQLRNLHRPMPWRVWRSSRRGLPLFGRSSSATSWPAFPSSASSRQSFKTFGTESTRAFRVKHSRPMAAGSSR